MKIEDQLKGIEQDSRSSDMAWTARVYREHLESGYIASNSPSLIAFLQNPNKYIAEHGAVVYPSSL